MKKLLISILALAAFSLPVFAQSKGSITTTGFIVNSGSAPILISGTISATGSLTLNAPPIAADNFTIASTSGTQSYTFVSTLVNGAGNQILIGGTTSGVAGTLVALNAAFTNTGTTASYISTGTNLNVSGSISGNSYLLTAYATGTSGNGVATTGSFVQPAQDFFSGPTLTGGALATTGTIPLWNLPASSGTYVLTAVDAVYLSGTVNNSTVAILGGTNNLVLTGTTTLTGTVATSYTHIAANTAPGTVIITGTAASPISLKLVTTGTATSPFTVRLYIKGYFAQ